MSCDLLTLSFKQIMGPNNENIKFGYRNMGIFYNDIAILMEYWNSVLIFMYFMDFNGVLEYWNIGI